LPRVRNARAAAPCADMHVRATVDLLNGSSIGFEKEDGRS